MRCGEHVEPELREGGEENQRRGEEHEREGNQQVHQVVGSGPAERRLERADRVCDQRPQDVSGRRPERSIALVELRGGPLVEVRQDEADRNRRDGGSNRGDSGSDGNPPARKCVPEPHSRDDERDFLLRERRKHREGRKGDEAVLVEVPEGEKQERARERNGVELVQRQPLRRGIEEVREREAEARALGAEVLSGKPEHRQRAERDRGGLHRDEHARARPEPPERSEGGEDRIDVRAEPRDLLTLEVRHRQRVPVRGRPDGLSHVAEVEPPGVERAVAQDRKRAEAGRVGRERCPEESFRREHQRSSSINDRHRAPSTSSLARSS